MSDQKLSPGVLAQSLTLPCCLVLPSRLVKCPVEEIPAVAPFYVTSVTGVSNLYGQSANAKIITG